MLSVKGDHLDSGCQISDYTVSIGADYCTMAQLMYNQLACTPPLQQPPVGNLLHPYDLPQVVVSEHVCFLGQIILVSCGIV
jgi:hypothetical protein